MTVDKRNVVEERDLQGALMVLIQGKQLRKFQWTLNKKV